MLSPVDIQNKVFKKNKIGGYHIEEVNDFMDEIVKSYQELTNENYGLKDKITILNESIQYYRTMESTIQNVLVLADKTAQDTKSAAYEKAEQVKKEAEQRAEKLIFSAQERVSMILEEGRKEAFELTQQIAEIKRQYAAYKIQFKQIMQAQLDIIDVNEDASLAKQKDHLQPQEESNEQGPLDEYVSMPYANDEEKFYTKEYMPINDEELA